MSHSGHLSLIPAPDFSGVPVSRITLPDRSDVLLTEH